MEFESSQTYPREMNRNDYTEKEKSFHERPAMQTMVEDSAKHDERALAAHAEQRVAEQDAATELLKKMYVDAEKNLGLKNTEREARALVQRQTHASSHEHTIRTHEALRTSELGGGVNRTEFVELKDDGSIVFKPISGENFVSERMNANIEAGTYYKRERAAYIVSEYFGFKLVPPTVIREIDGETGSAQEFIHDAKPAYELLDRDRDSLFEKINFVGKHTDRKYTDALATLYIFDHLIWNFDRHMGNFLLKDGSIHAIDNGFAFNRRGDKDHLAWRAHRLGFYYDKKAPADIVSRFQEFVSRPESEDDLRSQMEGLLSVEEIDALIYRAKEMAKRFSESATVPETALLLDGEWDIRFNKKL